MIIQISNPTVLKNYDEDDETIAEALQSIFPHDTEMAFLKWNYIYIPLSYKYDISIIAVDFINLYEFLHDSRKEYLVINWPSSTFVSKWEIFKDGHNLKIVSKWEEVLGEVSGLLNSDNILLIKTNELYLELEKILLFLKKSLEINGYNNNNLLDFYLFEKINLTL